MPSPCLHLSTVIAGSQFAPLCDVLTAGRMVRAQIHRAMPARCGRTALDLHRAPTKSLHQLCISPRLDPKQRPHHISAIAASRGRPVGLMGVERTHRVRTVAERQEIDDAAATFEQTLRRSGARHRALYAEQAAKERRGLRGHRYAHDVATLSSTRGCGTVARCGLPSSFTRMNLAIPLLASRKLRWGAGRGIDWANPPCQGTTCRTGASHID